MKKRFAEGNSHPHCSPSLALYRNDISNYMTVFAPDDSGAFFPPSEVKLLEYIKIRIITRKRCNFFYFVKCSVTLLAKL